MTDLDRVRRAELEMKRATTGLEFVDVEELEELALMSSSKGNQRKWFDSKNKCYIKEQFYYQGVYWADWKVEAMSSIVSRDIDVGVQILKQTPVLLSTGNYGVISHNFCEQGESFLSFKRILDKNSLEYNQNIFPMDNFESVIDIVKSECNLDITNYLIVMCVLDYVLLNEDRHLNNFGVVSGVTGFRQAVLFDFGLGLFEHDRRYNGRNYESAYQRTVGKPFHSDMFSILVALSRSKYKHLLSGVVKQLNWDGVDVLIPNTLAREHITLARKNLEELL